MDADRVIGYLDITQRVVTYPECNTTATVYDRVVSNYNVIRGTGGTHHPKRRAAVLDPVALCKAVRSVDFNASRCMIIRWILIYPVVQKLSVGPFRIEEAEV